jgi:hypothetical protein
MGTWQRIRTTAADWRGGPAARRQRHAEDEAFFDYVERVGAAQAAPEDRLAAIADLISPCPAPDALAGEDRCAHGTWPCATTEAAWLAQGRDRGQELRAVQEALARGAAIEDAGREVQQEQDAAERDGRPPYWELEAGG